MKRIIFATLCLSAVMFLGCSVGSETNSNGSSNKSVNAKLPEGINTKPIKPDGKTTPGIPDPKKAKIEYPANGTPIPGIPDPKTVSKTPYPKDVSPAPGIPSQNELKKMRERKVDPNEVNRPVKTDKEVTSPIDRKRRVKNKP